MRTNAVAAVAAAALAGCAGARVRYAADGLATRLPSSVAVLPFDNEALSLRAPILLRRLATAALAERGWPTADGEAVDAALAGLGVSDGGQLRAVDPRRVGEAVGAPGLLYGTVEEFTYQNVGFLRRRAVRLSLRLVEAATGELLWEASGEEVNSRLALRRREAGRSFVEGVVEQAAETALGVPLGREARAAVDEALSHLTRRF